MKTWLMSFSILLCLSFELFFVGRTAADSHDVITTASRRTGRRCYGGKRNLLNQLSSAVTSFSANLHTTVSAGKRNAVYSPYSIFQALSMTYLGARRYTAHEMKHTMGLRTLGRCIHEAIHLASTNMSDERSLIVKSANRIYVRDDVQLLDEFQHVLQSSYDSLILPFDWSGDKGPEWSINAWVSNVTEGLIPDLLTQGTITHDTAMLLVNAIYFKANWTTVFEKSDTVDETFHQTAQQQTTVPMMHLEGRFRFLHLEDLKTRILFLPYTGNRFGMYIFLPDDIDGLSAVESAMMSVLANSLDGMSFADVRVALPRFKLESSFDLKEALVAMGMVRPFSARHADFSRIAGRRDLFISQVIHRAVVDVTEAGTEAAASTAVRISLTSFISDWVEFKADHPFLFVIRDNLTKLPLFVGKYSGGD